MFGKRNRNRQPLFSRVQDRQPLVVARPLRQAEPVRQVMPTVEVQEAPVTTPSTEPTEALTTPLITGKNQNVVIIQVINAGATTQKAVIFDALGAINRTAGDANGADITVRSTTHDYDSFKKTLENNRYQIQEMVFDTAEANKATLDNPVNVKTYDNGIGVANVTDKFIPSSYKSENQFNTNIFTVRRNIDLNSFKALVTDVAAGATVTITFRMK